MVSEENGVWGQVVTFPADEFGGVDSIFCVSAGNCLAGGNDSDIYTDPSQGFVAVERNGRWGREFGVPGLADLNGGGYADVGSLSCPSPGNCAAGGTYTDSAGNYQGFAVLEQHGAWGLATGVPGLAALNKGGDAEVSAVSCASADSCVAGGYYTEKGGGDQGFVTVEQNGTWGPAIAVPGLAALNNGGKPTTVSSVSCTPAGSCVVGGFYTDRFHHRQGFVTGEDNGGWGTPIPVPGLAALNKGGSAKIGSLSCPSPGSCAAAGFYAGHSGYHRGFVTQAS